MWCLLTTPISAWHICAGVILLFMAPQTFCLGFESDGHWTYFALGVAFGFGGCGCFLTSVKKKTRRSVGRRVLSGLSGVCAALAAALLFGMGWMSLHDSGQVVLGGLREIGVVVGFIAGALCLAAAVLSGIALFARGSTGSESDETLATDKSPEDADSCPS
jgi:hypothetical protein